MSEPQPPNLDRALIEAAIWQSEAEGRELGQASQIVRWLRAERRRRAIGDGEATGEAEEGGG